MRTEAQKSQRRWDVLYNNVDMVAESLKNYVPEAVLRAKKKQEKEQTSVKPPKDNDKTIDEPKKERARSEGLSPDRESIQFLKDAKERRTKMRESKSENKIEYKDKYPTRHKANLLAQKAMEVGYLVKQPCEKCGKTEKIHAHHWSYKTKNWLNVIWLCPGCHRKEHVRIKQDNECID